MVECSLAYRYYNTAGDTSTGCSRAQFLSVALLNSSNSRPTAAVHGMKYASFAADTTVSFFRKEQRLYAPAPTIAAT